MNERISRHAMNMSIASVVAKRSTCDRLHVGAVIVREGRVMASGYNGSVRGALHCDHTVREFHTADTYVNNKPPLRRSVEGGCKNAVHAEANAILYAAKYGVATDGAELYTTHQPCENCARMIVNAGISKVVFQEPYRLPEGLNLLIRSELVVYQYMPADDSLIQQTEYKA